MPKNLQRVRSEFIEKIGLQSQADGMPRIAGRMLGLLIWDGDAVAFGDLSEKLQVSRGSISTASRILEDRRLIRRTAKPGERQDFFQISDNPYANMMEGIKTSMQRSKDEIDSSLAEIPDNEAGIKARVGAYSEFYKKISDAVEKVSVEIK